MSDTTDAHLAAQYEAYPYPKRDPRDEARRLIVGSPSHLREIDHWVFGAARPASRPLNALIAGGGTGDGTIMLAQHLATANRPGTVTYLDRSSASLAIAKSRAEARGLTNIIFRQGSLLDLPNSGLGPFDYIDCCGVLHHLPDPDAGLAALLSVLAPDGGLGIMLYAPHGRTGVYMLQDALRTLAPEDAPPERRLDAARRVMRHLPQTAWLKRNTLFTDHLTGGDAGLYDLLLNPRDRPYDIPALAAFIDRAGLRLSCLMEPLRYDPAAYLQDPKLRARIAELDPIARAALAENLAGNMCVHIFYAVRKDNQISPPDPTNPAAIPIAREGAAADLIPAIRPDGAINFNFDGLSLPVPVPRRAAALLGLIDGTRNLAAILDLMEQRGNPRDAAASDWTSLYASLNAANQLLLAAPA